ncbi:uncharacterized protein BDR25DRAFT_348692 [Lindgomyces ingoldianus]|uniref:Uncharacterized protein n=1 Tax=Lindgomyces ingoldianus TaxID=673940 RepID=A0ACB6RH67_9PLEO|nr:uncharacterized protein BDR25DRAFT_348692 [Lindgomyces ingoldianus]KAF2478410.1 hypothetical protein BDR25DRAFT_348692 [Lindgomyces ingoldianus]
MSSINAAVETAILATYTAQLRSVTAISAALIARLRSSIKLACLHNLILHELRRGHMANDSTRERDPNKSSGLTIYLNSAVHGYDIAVNNTVKVVYQPGPPNRLLRSSKILQHSLPLLKLYAMHDFRAGDVNSTAENVNQPSPFELHAETTSKVPQAAGSIRVALKRSTGYHSGIGPEIAPKAAQAVSSIRVVFRSSIDCHVSNVDGTVNKQKIPQTH